MDDTFLPAKTNGRKNPATCISIV